MFSMEMKKLHDQVNSFWYEWKDAWLSTSITLLSSVYQFGIAFFAIHGKRGARQIASSPSTTVTSADFFSTQYQLFAANFGDSRQHW